MTADQTSPYKRDRIKVTFQPMDLTHDKLLILQELDRIAVEKLFGTDTWPATDAEVGKLSHRFIELGLDAKVNHNTTQPTALGRELHVGIQMVFLGLYASWDLVWALEENGLIEPQLAMELLETMGNDCEPLLKEHVVAAYKAYYKKVSLFAPGRWRI